MQDFSIPFGPSLPTFAAPASLDNPAATVPASGVGLALSRPSVAPLSLSGRQKETRRDNSLYLKITWL